MLPGRALSTCQASIGLFRCFKPRERAKNFDEWPGGRRNHNQINSRWDQRKRVGNCARRSSIGLKYYLPDELPEFASDRAEDIPATARISLQPALTVIMVTHDSEIAEHGHKRSFILKTAAFPRRKQKKTENRAQHCGFRGGRSNILSTHTHGF